MKQRGLFKDTLVIWAESRRLPISQLGVRR